MCSPRRSQHRNKAKALELLARRVGGALAQRRAAEESAQRLSLRGSGDRSERIRTYNAPHDRVRTVWKSNFRRLRHRRCPRNCGSSMAYNLTHWFTQVTDRRCHVTSPGVPRVLGGEIEVFVDALIQLDADERVAAFEAS